MRSIRRAASFIGCVSLLVLTLVECTPGRGQHALDGARSLVPKREGRIADLSDHSYSTNLQVESVTSLRAQQQQQQQLVKLHVNTTTQNSSPRFAQAQSKSPALQRLIAQSQATKVDTISSTSGGGGGDAEQVSRARSISGGGGGGGTNPDASARAGEEALSPPSARQAKCVIHGRGRSLRDILTGAKNLATGGFSSIEQRAGTILWFGSNVLATLIPLASLLPSFGLAAGSGKPASPLTTKDQAIGANHHTAEATASTSKRTIGSLLSPQNLIFSLASNAGGLHSRVEHVMGWLERSIEHLPNFPRLHPQECVKRCICEAHADPTKYGALGLTLRLLFPATQLSITEGQDNMEYKVINKYRHAAGYGMARRVMDSSSLTTGDQGNGTTSGGWTTTTSGEHNNLAATAACKEKYEDCLVSLLDVAQNLADLFLNKS